MTSQKRSYVPILLILMAISLSAYILTNDNSPKNHDKATTNKISSAPDISLEGIRQTFVEQGREKWKLKANSARLSRSSNQTQIDNIDVTFFTDDGKPFHVTADRGTVSIDTKDAEVSGNVIINHLDYKIYTQSLRYLAEQHIIKTDDQVRIESDAIVLTGDRLYYNLVSMKAELTGNVNGIINENLTRSDLFIQ